MQMCDDISYEILEKAIIKAVKSSIPKLGNGRIKVVFRTFVQPSLCMHHDIIFNYMIRYCIFHSTLSHSVRGTRMYLNKWISFQYFLLSSVLSVCSHALYNTWFIYNTFIIRHHALQKRCE